VIKVPEWIAYQSNDSYVGCFLRSTKVRGLLEYVYAAMWEYVFIVKVWF